jgi:hypothetical protein
MELNMVKERKTKANGKSKSPDGLGTTPWVSMRSGIIIISITSLGMMVLTAIQTVPIKGWAEGLLWGIFFGALIWAIFFGLIFINRFLRH